jgi:hypothetical protein
MLVGLTHLHIYVLFAHRILMGDACYYFQFQILHRTNVLVYYTDPKCMEWPTSELPELFV